MHKMWAVRCAMAMVVLGCLIFPALASGQERQTEITNAGGPKCTNATLKGTYGGSTSGQVNIGGQWTSLTFAGNTTFDGHGNISGSDITSFGGTILPLETFTGTYSVDADCSGNVTAYTTESGTLHYYFVIVSGGAEFDMVGTDPGVLIAGSSKRR